MSNRIIELGVLITETGQVWDLAQMWLIFRTTCLTNNMKAMIVLAKYGLDVEQIVQDRFAVSCVSSWVQPLRITICFST